MKRVTTRAELVALAEELGVRPDWHEPDEQNVTVTTHGVDFDNAGFWPAEKILDPHSAHITRVTTERYVVICRDEAEVAAVNLATLFAWACNYDGQYDRAREAEYRLLDVKLLTDRLERNHDVSRDIIAELREACDGSTGAARISEAEWRSRASREVYTFAEEIAGQGSGVARAVSAVVREVGDRLGKMGGA